MLSGPRLVLKGKKGQINRRNQVTIPTQKKQLSFCYLLRQRQVQFYTQLKDNQNVRTPKPATERESPRELRSSGQNESCKITNWASKTNQCSLSVNLEHDSTMLIVPHCKKDVYRSLRCTWHTPRHVSKTIFNFGNTLM